jgi:hypothetical protein
MIFPPPIPLHAPLYYGEPPSKTVAVVIVWGIVALCVFAVRAADAIFDQGYRVNHRRSAFLSFLAPLWPKVLFCQPKEKTDE